MALEPNREAAQVPGLKTGHRRRRLAEAIDNFGFNLFREMVSDERDSNVVISPYSIFMGLLMACSGAAGCTRDEMISALELQDFTPEQIENARKLLSDQLRSPDNDVIGSIPERSNNIPKRLSDVLRKPETNVTFLSANSLWYDSAFKVKTEYINMCKNSFGAEIRPANFVHPSCADIINNWAARNTNNKIPVIVNPPLSSDMGGLLINAIYFNGHWFNKFNIEFTEDAEFTLADGKKIICKLMLTGGHFYYFENDGLQMIRVPYEGTPDYNMLIILPRPNMNIDKTILSLDIEKWLALLEKLERREGSLFLPRFKSEYSQRLNGSLSRLGIKLAFGESADFSGISENDPFFISEIAHKTYIDSDEKGTEAAAVTFSLLEMCAATELEKEIPFEMRVDRPFIFAIEEYTSGAIIFLGTVANPNSDESYDGMSS